MVSEGDIAPDFQLPTDDGRILELGGMKGSPVVLYFYPKDDTSGCTKEALAFTEHANDFLSLGAPVVGERQQRGLGHRVHGVGRHEVVDVEHVRVRGVLRARRGP